MGIGVKDKSKNPFARFPVYFFAGHGGAESFSPPGFLIPTDAHMGIKGLPQSATGQTALFTGFNGPEIVNRHINGFPTFSLRPYIKEKSIIKEFLKNGKTARLLNSYSQWYLNRIKGPRSERMLSATSMMQFGTGQPIFTIEDYIAGRSLYMDITNWFLRKMGTDIPFIAPKESGRKAVRIAREYNLAIYEYFFTDKVGHSKSMAASKRIIQHIEGFLEGVWEEIDSENELVIMSSDHGNMEDLSEKNHTENAVGTIVFGCGTEQIKDKIKYLYDIPREILHLYGISWSKETSFT